MGESSKLVIAGLISTALRRKINRVIDVEWMMNNAEYAKEVIRISRQIGIDELSRYADRMEELVMGRLPEVQPATASVPHETARAATFRPVSEGESGLDSQYIGTLR